MNVSSVFADRGGPTVEYCSAKYALRGLTRTAAKEYAARGIRINELQPGVIDTEMTQGNPDGVQKVVDRGIPLGRVGRGHEIATAIAFLLTGDASYITGAHLAVDGGGPDLAPHCSNGVYRRTRRYSRHGRDEQIGVARRKGAMPAIDRLAYLARALASFASYADPPLIQIEIVSWGPERHSDFGKAETS